MASIVIQPALLPLESVQLGRFILSVDEPQSEYYDAACDAGPEAITAPQTHYREVQQREADRVFAAALTRFVSVSHRKRKRVVTRVSSSQVSR